MWLLTCDGDLFGGKRIWLRPGSTHLLGRTTGRSENGERIQYINHKSVSRKHLTIEVSPTKPGDSSRLHTRSEIKLKDGSKIGTTLNGQKFSQETKILDGKEYEIKLGSYEDLFHLWWHPVTLSFTSLSKKTTGESQREKLEGTDIKVVKEFVTNETTHAIAKKRNTAAGLQALVQARWLIAEGFADALVSAVEQRDPDELSLLEEDFEANWPKETDYIVPSAGEPQPRPDEFLKPNKDRMEIFQNFVFIFLSQSQYDALLPVVTSGGGKAVLWEFEPGRSKIEDFTEYAKELAGQKGSGPSKLSQSSGPGGILAVRTNERPDGLREFMHSVDLALDQRSLEQSEFLDTILTLDTSVLRKPLDEESEDVNNSNANAASVNSRAQSQARQQQRAVTIPDSPPAEQAPQRTQLPVEDQMEEHPAEEADTMPKKRNRRIITQSRFKGFDDFDPSQFNRAASASPSPSGRDQEVSQSQSVENMDVDEPSRNQQSSRKRPAPVQEAEEEEDMYATIMPGHTALKRRKTEAAKNGDKSFSKSATETSRAAVEKTAKAKKKKELDVVAEMQARREREEEERRKDEEALRDAMDGIDIKDLKNLAKVEDMEIPDRVPPTRRAAESGTSDRWDPAWNGRKNFKKFRHQGQRADGPRLQRVIVTLEEVPRKGHGIGDEYWLNSSAATSNKSKSQSQSQSTRAPRSQQTTANDDEHEDSTRFRRRLQNSRREDEENAATETVFAEEIADQPRDETLNSTPSQTFGRAKNAAGKRPAAQQAAGTPAAKKARQASAAMTRSRETINLDDDDDDELKFRRRRR